MEGIVTWPRGRAGQPAMYTACMGVLEPGHGVREPGKLQEGKRVPMVNRATQGFRRSGILG